MMDARSITEGPIVIGEPSGGFLTLSNLEEAASKKVSAPAWAYVRGGAGEKGTLRANREVFQKRTLRPRVLIDVPRISEDSVGLPAGASDQF